MLDVHSADGFYNLEIPALVDDLADGVALPHPREDVDFVALDALGAEKDIVCNLARSANAPAADKVNKTHLTFITCGLSPQMVARSCLWAKRTVPVRS